MIKPLQLEAVFSFSTLRKGQISYLRIVNYSWDYILMGGIYVLAGLAHWVYPKIYKSIIPPWVPYRSAVVWSSGLLEIVLGLALFYPPFREAALYGIMGMLLLFLPVHTYMLGNAQRYPKFPYWLLWTRIPIQGLLIYWAYHYL